MGLVDYASDSGSDSESEPTPVPKPAQKPTARPGAKKPIEKLKGADGKIRVTLTETKDDAAAAERPAKRARTEGGVFSGFNSFLPPPKNANKPAGLGASGSSGGGRGSAPKPGVHLRTGAAPGFSRDGGGAQNGEYGLGAGEVEGKKDGPAIPEGMKSEEEVKLVGKPLMFKPLCVTRKPVKKTGAKTAAKASTTTAATTSVSAAHSAAQPELAKPGAPKKVSLFSLPTDNDEPTQPTNSTYEYETIAPAASYQPAAQEQAPAPTAQPASLDNIADDLHLSTAARRDLFGRGNVPPSAAQVRSFNLDKEYQANEELRASGEQQTHNPVRAIMGGGKHNLRQLVSNVTNQREALEESFASGKNKRNATAGRYGW